MCHAHARETRSPSRSFVHIYIKVRQRCPGPLVSTYFPRPEERGGGEGGAHSRAQYRLRINLQKKGNKSQNMGTGVRENRIDSRELVSTAKIDFAPFPHILPSLAEEKKRTLVTASSNIAPSHFTSIIIYVSYACLATCWYKQTHSRYTTKLDATHARCPRVYDRTTSLCIVFFFCLAHLRRFSDRESTE